MSLPKYRQIREEPKFKEQLEALGVTHKRLDDVMTMVTFAVSQNPESFESVPGTRLRVIKTPVYPNAPSLRIFFTFDDEEVHLLHIEFCDDVTPFIQYEEE